MNKPKNYSTDVNYGESIRFIVAGLLVILAALLYVLAHPVP